MTKLTKKDIAERDNLTAELRDKRATLDEAIEAYNTAAATAWSTVEEALAAYNEAFVPAVAWVEEKGDAIAEYIGGKSDKWQESNRGEQFGTWREAFERFDGDAIELDKPEELELAYDDHADLIDDLPTSPDEV